MPAPVTGRRCWVLLVKVEAERIDLELSVPDGMRDGLWVWAERVPLPPLPLGDLVEPGEQPVALDVPVVALP